MKWIFLAAVLASMPASAQSIYKCRDAKGGAVYQSDPCPNSAQQPVVVGIGTSSRGVGAAIPAVTATCRSARNQRDNYYRNTGSNRTFDRASAWDSYVRNACT